MSMEIERAKYEKVWQSDDYRKFSPGLKVIKQFDLIKAFKDFGIESILDVGCGSGKALKAFLDAGFDAHGFDIADNCLDPDLVESCHLTTGCVWTDGDLPAGFDLIFCTDVCEHLPPEHVIDSLRCMKEASGKYVFLSIALFADSFGHKLLGEPLHLSHHDSAWWLRTIEQVGLKTTMVKIETRNSTEELWLHCLCH